MIIGSRENFVHHGNNGNVFNASIWVSLLARLTSSDRCYWQSFLLLRQLLLLLLLLFHRGHAGLYLGSGLQILALERNSVRHQLVLSVLSLR